ncbi:MAG: relaxase/mobilization nuclease domain-containing protein [Clostridia bacterium]|nr:relaxase/mobilization nuclease domain-containing protein [Clostridia bacterium]
MAVTFILPKKMRIDKLVKYVINPEKTAELKYVASVLCDTKTAAREWLATKDRYGKRDGVQAYHLIQSFPIGELSPELAHEIGRRFIAEFLDGYEVVMGTHTDKDHVHNHIIFNSVNKINGMKYTATMTDYYKGIRAVSDSLCKEYGLSVIYETSGKAMSYIEHLLQKSGAYTNRELFEINLNECLHDAYDLGNFYALMQQKGYKIRHDSKYPTFVPPGAKYGFRAKQEGISLTEEQIEEIIMNGMLVGAPDVVIRRREFVPYKAHGKQHGFMALVTSWMYVLGIIRSGKETNYRVSTKDVLRFEQYKRDEEFLRKYGIDNESQLDDREKAINAEIERLTKSRIIWNSQKKRRKKLYDALSDSAYYSEAAQLYAEGVTGVEEEYRKYLAAEELLDGIDREELFREQSEVYKRIAEVNRQLRELRSELTIIRNVRRDIPHIAEELREPEEQTHDRYERTNNRELY